VSPDNTCMEKSRALNTINTITKIACKTPARDWDLPSSDKSPEELLWLLLRKKFIFILYLSVLLFSPIFGSRKF
jgi:hypothetical protein